MSEWQFRDYQEKMAKDALPIFLKNKVVYLTGQERVGKTGASIKLINDVKLNNVDTIKVLIVTKKAALDDWLTALDNFPRNFEFTITTYGLVHKVSGKHHLAILDECHNFLSVFPITKKNGKTLKLVRQKVYGLPLIYISATPHAQGYHQLYTQLTLSAWSPWKSYLTSYSWYNYYALRDARGDTEKRWLNSREVETYTCLQEGLVKSCVDHLFVTMTRKQAGFKQEPKDKVHFVELSEGIKTALKTLIKKRVLRFRSGGESYIYEADSISKLRTGLHQMEQGTLKMSKTLSLILSDTSKIDYIKKHFKDDNNLVIMYNFKKEQEQLQKHFKNATILQATSFSEGVDLYEFEHLVVYSQDYSVARHSQRRARQANKLRETPIWVHHLIVRGGISEQIFNTVNTNKLNFVDSRFNLGEVNYD